MPNKSAGWKIEKLQINRGVRQGCIKVTLLLKLYTEFLITEALQEILVNEIIYNSMRHADDIVPIVNNDDLEMLLNTVNAKNLEYGGNWHRENKKRDSK